MSKYTVVLLRPDYIASDDVGGYGQDIYVAIGVEGATPRDAVAAAQAEAYAADSELGPLDPDDYYPLVVFKGVLAPVLFGWQL